MRAVVFGVAAGLLPVVGVLPGILVEGTPRPALLNLRLTNTIEIGHDPRYKAAMSHLRDMLPLAVKTHRELLTNAETPATVKMKAVELVYKLNGVNEPDNPASDRQELARWLTGKDINLTQLNIAIPPEYMDSYKELFGNEVVEREVIQPKDADERMPEW
jgi:hypothetical protein